MNPLTKQQLFEVRNKINIDWLINEKLSLERQFKGIWRFRCPLCGQFNTATQKKTNLARCFSCQKNFNTIDLVIYCKKINFVPSVKFLLALFPQSSPHVNDEIKDNTINCPTKREINVVDRKKAVQAIEKIRQIIR